MVLQKAKYEKIKADSKVLVDILDCKSKALDLGYNGKLYRRHLHFGYTVYTLMKMTP